MATLEVTDVRFEHHHSPVTLGVHETTPRLSWRFNNAPSDFQQEQYEVQLAEVTSKGLERSVSQTRRTSADSYLVPWAHDSPIRSRESYSARVRVLEMGNSQWTPWSERAVIEAGLLKRSDWSSDFISAPWAEEENEPLPEDLFRKTFNLDFDARKARLYITAHGLYETEINGKRVGDHFMAPGWSSYDARLAYQTYDVTGHLRAGQNCIGIRVAEGWFKGRISFGGGRRNTWGTRCSVLAQLEVIAEDDTRTIIGTDSSWLVTQGPTRLAEIYDGEKYDANADIAGWSEPGDIDGEWTFVIVLPMISESVKITADHSEPVRRIEQVEPVQTITTPSGKTVVDFGKNIVGYVRIKNVKGPRGLAINLTHAEVLEDQELGIRPLRFCKAQDRYILAGSDQGEVWEPRFTFHGFRYVQVDGWPSATESLLEDVEAVVCHTDMEETGTWSCSNDDLNTLFDNIRRSMRGNFFSVPTDCPQRDERMGWTGDLAVFAPTASFVYDCFSILRDWLLDLWYEQQQMDGVPPVVSPNLLRSDKTWGKPHPCAIWGDAAVLVPWALWEETGDRTILSAQYPSVREWLTSIPKGKTGRSHLWDPNVFQFADWLDPNAPSEEPMKATTDPVLVADAYLIRSLDIANLIAEVLGKSEDATHWSSEATSARKEFSDEYVAPNGRLVSDTQTSYALAICFKLLRPHQITRAGDRLAEIVSRNKFRVGTGFAGTPFVCEALVQTAHNDVAYAMLLNKSCPSWLYPVTMGATTIWERWDSMLPDGSINPGEMTSFNHYAYGAVATFMVDRLAGLQRLEPGWKKMRFDPVISGGLTSAAARHLTPYGPVSASWALEHDPDGGTDLLVLEVNVPPTTAMDVILPTSSGPEVKTVGSGRWSFRISYTKSSQWPIQPIISSP